MKPTEVCALHRQHHYDLILLDLKKPAMYGLSVMAAFKTNESESQLPLIVL